MTIAFHDTLRDAAAHPQTYELRVTVIRYLGAGSAADAAAIGTRGVQTVDSIPGVAVEYATIRTAEAQPYRHAGEDGLWRVSVPVDGVVLADSAETAREAAYQLVTVESRSDAFEFEIEVDNPRHR